MLPAGDLFVYVYVLIDDLAAARITAIPPPPGRGAALQRRRAARQPA